MLKILGAFYGFLFRRKKISVLFVFLIITAPVINSVQPYFYKLFVDKIPEGDFALLVYIMLIYLAVRLTGLYVEVLARFVGDFLLQDGSVGARVAIFKHIHDLDFAFHSNKSTGSLISTFKRGDGAFYDLYDSLHFRITYVVVSFAVVLFFFSTINVTIVALALISLIVSMLITLPLLSRNIVRRNLFNEEEDIVSGVIVDNLINFESVKLFAKEKWEQNRLFRQFIPWRKRFWGYSNSFRVIDFTLGTAINLGFMLILFVALSMAANTEITLGEFVLVAGLLSSLTPEIWELFWSIRNIAKNYVDIKKYFGVLDNEVKIKDPNHPIRLASVKGEVEFSNVTFSYEKRRLPAIKNVNLHIRQGQSVALAGKSGAGKTTIVKLLMRFYDVDEGKILLDGTDIRKFTKSGLRSHIGVVPQEPVLFDNSISYNISYGNSKASKQEIEAAAKLANIHDFIKSLPEGYKTRVGERGIKLSGGQKQRLAIARMILSDPDIIVFDEATSQLDSESEALIQDAIWKAAKNKTMIIIAHRLSTIVRADKIVLMQDGKIKEIGSHKELVAKKNGLYRHFWELQSRTK